MAGKLKDKKFKIILFNIQQWIVRIKQYLNQYMLTMSKNSQEQKQMEEYMYGDIICDDSAKAVKT